MGNSLVYCFSGQGSHYYQMGKELYANNVYFKKWMNQLDEVVKPLINKSVVSVIYSSNNKVSDKFDETIITHPAIFMVQYSLYRMLCEKNIYPEYVLGASLGEFTAMAIAGVLNFEEVLRIIIKHAELVEKNCPRGLMLAVLNSIGYFCELQNSFPDIELASINSDNHFVISGTENTLIQIEKLLKNQNIVNQILPVSRAFHSKYINSAAEEFIDFVKPYKVLEPSIPYLSCTLGKIYGSNDFTPEYFWNITSKPIQFKKTIDFIEGRLSSLFVDLGPSGTLINLIRQNLNSQSKSGLVTTLSPFGRDLLNMEKAEQAIKINNHVTLGGI